MEQNGTMGPAKNRNPRPKTPARAPAAAVDDAGRIAIEALTFLAEDADRLSKFLAETGISPEELRAKAGDPATLAAILDYVLTDESLLLTFAANTGIAPDTIQPTRHKLAGPTPPWDS